MKAKFLCGCIAATCVIISFQKAQAQAYQRIAPQMPLGHATPQVTIPGQTSHLPASNAVIVHSIQGIIVTDPQHFVKEGRAPEALSYQIAVNNAPDADKTLGDDLRSFLGQPMTFNQLRRIGDVVIAWYRAHGRPFVHVTVPPQNVNSGILQIQVVEYRVGKIQVDGNQWFSDRIIKAAVGLKPGQTVTLPELEEDLNWANQNAFRTVNAVFQPGASLGLMDVDLKTKDRFPLRFYGGYDNEGVPSLGLNEWYVGFNWGNAFNSDQTLSYQLTKSFNGHYTAHSASDVIPLPWRDEIQIFGSYEQERPLLGPFFAETGHSGQASIRYVHDLPKLGWITGDVEIGYDFKTTDTNLEFGGVQVFSATARIDQFPLIIEGTEHDLLGTTSIRNDLILSPGGIQAGNSNAAFRAMVPYSNANYLYDRMTLSRITSLPLKFSLLTRVQLQDSTTNLLDSEELVGGGPGSALGYRTDTALGSKGVLAAAELRAPPVQMPYLGKISSGVLQPIAFWNYADLHQVTSIPNLPRTIDLASLGIGLNYQNGDNLDLKFAIGWQLRSAPGVLKKGGYGDISVSIGM